MIEVLKSGLHSSIQDLGRFGFRKYGVPISGAMDEISAQMANGILNNNENCAVMEITMLGPKLLFKSETRFVISGAELSPRLNNKSIRNNKIYHVSRNDILSFGKLKNGVRSYIAVQGGFKTEFILDSFSFYKPITKSSVLREKDLIMIDEKKITKENKTGVINNKNSFFNTSELLVSKGPEFNLFEKKEQGIILKNQFSVSNDNNRMGYRLNKKVIEHNKSIITSPVLPGTVQLAPSGQMIILMKDAQTTGGYPRIFQLTNKSIAILAQKRTGDKINFIVK